MISFVFCYHKHGHALVKLGTEALSFNFKTEKVDQNPEQGAYVYYALFSSIFLHSKHKKLRFVIALLANVEFCRCSEKRTVLKANYLLICGVAFQFRSFLVQDTLTRALLLSRIFLIKVPKVQVHFV